MGVSKRGWMIDRLLAIGHLEACLSHFDELADGDYFDLKRDIYQTRKELMSDLFSKADIKDDKLWCVVKHLATAYVMECEIAHSTISTGGLATMTGDCLAGACELALGIEQTNCLRCLSEREDK